MSFDYLACDHCDFSHPGIPMRYFRQEDGEIRIHAYPTGSVSFIGCVGFAPSEAVIINSSGYVADWFCLDCKSTNRIPDVDEKRCRDCGSQRMTHLSTLENKSCPNCGTGTMNKKSSVIDF